MDVAYVIAAGILGYVVGLLHETRGAQNKMNEAEILHAAACEMLAASKKMLKEVDRKRDEAHSMMTKAERALVKIVGAKSVDGE